MNGFYTNVALHRGQLLVIGYEDGKRFKSKVHYKPYLFVPSKDVDSRFRTIYGEPVNRVDFDSIWDATQFIRKYEDVQGFSIYGSTMHQYVYINDKYSNCQYDTSKIKTAILDIEVDTETGFPDLELANKPINAITLMYKDITWVLGLDDFVTDDPKIKYIKCKDEASLLTKFIKIWSSDLYCPDVVTGWNIEFFDIPYIVNRIAIVLGEDQAKKLSPWGVLDRRTIETFGKQVTVFVPLGISVLDYFHLYKKFSLGQRESYKLDYICNYEIGEKKVDYTEYKSLAHLCRENHQKFIEYNIRDCGLIAKLDAKMQLLDLVYTFAYDSGSNFIDALTSVRAWDIIIHNHLIKRKVVIPQKIRPEAMSTQIAGAHVKDPRTGFSDWVVSFDLTSLYPHLIMCYNISPDTLAGRLGTQLTVDQMLDGAVDDVRDMLIEKNVSLAASNFYFRKNMQGFLAELMQDLFEKRKLYKDTMIELSKQYKKSKDPALLNQIAKYDNLQKSTKVKLNSAYGALGNPYFRWYDRRLGESVTISGQLTIRWAEKYINQFLNEYLKTEGKDFVVASDTDSLYLDMSKVVDTFGIDKNDKKAIVAALDAFCEDAMAKVIKVMYNNLGDYMNCYKKVLHMKRESICERGVFTAKKRYFLSVHNNEGIAYDPPELKVMGLEAVRSSTPQTCRDAIKQLLSIILTGTEQQTIDFIANYKKQFSSLPFDQIAFPRTVNGLDKYSSSATVYKEATPIHVRGSILYNKMVEDRKLVGDHSLIVDKDKIKFCYLKIPNPIGENVIAAPQFLPQEFGLDQYIDYDLMFEKSFEEPVKTILDIIGWQVEKKNSVMDFFN
jgi:DNA polymerase elongation subunit (family B)